MDPPRGLGLCGLLTLAPVVPPRADGVFQGDEKLYALTDIVQFTSCGDVTALGKPYSLRAFWIGVVVLGVLAALAAAFMEED